MRNLLALATVIIGIQASVFAQSESYGHRHHGYSGSLSEWEIVSHTYQVSGKTVILNANLQIEKTQCEIVDAAVQIGSKTTNVFCQNNEELYTELSAETCTQASKCVIEITIYRDMLGPDLKLQSKPIKISING